MNYLGFITCTAVLCTALLITLINAELNKHKCDKQLIS